MNRNVIVTVRIEKMRWIKLGSMLLALLKKKKSLPYEKVSYISK